MVVYCVNVFVKDGFEDAFMRATRENRKGTRKEQGNVRFDILQAEDDKNHFFLFEVYKSEEAVVAHKQTEHYLKWRERVAPWMERPREGLKFKPIEPTDVEEW